MTPKLCKDCAFYLASATTDERDNFDKCLQARQVDLVRGGEKPKVKYCEERRSGDCGAEGRFWKARS